MLVVIRTIMMKPEKIIIEWHCLNHGKRRERLALSDVWQIKMNVFIKLKRMKKKHLNVFVCKLVIKSKSIRY